MNLERFWITVRLSRFELFAFGTALVVFIALVLGVAVWIDATRPPPECFADLNVIPPACDLQFRAWSDFQYGPAGVSVGVLTFLSLAMGLILGVPIVAREVERGTTRLAWSLSPSRTRWFLARMLPILAFVGVLAFVAGFAVDRVIVATYPETDIGRSFVQFGFHGGLLASRAIFIFAIATLVGSAIPRILPAFLIAGVVATMGISGGEQIHQAILAQEAVIIPINPEGGDGGVGPGDLYIDQRFVLTDGTVVGWQYFNDRGEEPYDQEGNPRYPMVSLVVPGARYPLVEAREAGALGGASIVALGLSALVVNRRRPG